MNAPPSPTVDLLQSLIKLYGIDIVMVLDDQEMCEKLEQTIDTEIVDVVSLKKTDGAFCEDAQTLRLVYASGNA